MLQLNNETTVYVSCPNSLETGGAESLHQLVSILNNLGIDAYIFYYNTSKCLNVTKKYIEYTSKVAYSIEDNSSNIIIIPEVATELIYRYKNIQKCIWWLSLDFYFRTIPSEHAKNNIIVNNIKNNNIKKIIHPMLSLIFKIRDKKFKILDFDKNLDNCIHHLYNCHYVKEFLISKGVNESNMHYLCGPIREDYVLEKNNIIKEKYNIITYNPAKEKNFYNKLIEYILRNRDDIIFIAIQNMSQIQVKTLLKKSKVYMDFGFFPGPERIPREAVASYCNIITSDKGSASNDVDVLVPRKYKYNIENDSLEKIYRGLTELLDNYEDNVYLYDDYRKKVYDQIERFNLDIKEIFGI